MAHAAQACPYLFTAEEPLASLPEVRGAGVSSRSPQSRPETLPTSAPKPVGTGAAAGVASPRELDLQVSSSLWRSALCRRLVRTHLSSATRAQADARPTGHLQLPSWHLRRVPGQVFRRKKVRNPCRERCAPVES